VNGTQVDGPLADMASASGPVQIRPARGGDGDAVRDFLNGLSLRTRYLRFFAGVTPASPAMLRRLTGAAGTPGAAGGSPGGADQVDALVATEGDVVIGHAMATDARDWSGATVTEIGIVVADARQGRGVGSALMGALARRAADRGATEMLMDVLAENRTMLAMITKRFPVARHDRSGPYVTIRVPLPPSDRHQEEQPREPLGTAREPEPSGPGRQRHRTQRAGRTRRARRALRARRAATGLPVAGPRGLGGCRASA
jgi:GNAT superfamily N-acetyltransferase